MAAGRNGRNGSGKPPPKKPWRPASAYIDQILARANEPWVTLELGMREICRCRPGGIIVVMGPSGGGKSSLVASTLVNHARHHGPAIYGSGELEGDEVVGRMIGMQTDASWEQALRGDVPREHMERVLESPRLVIMEDEDLNCQTLSSTIRDMREVYVDEPIVAAVDYIQIFELDAQEHRARIPMIMRALKKLAVKLRVVIIALNQMSRANAREARSGEKLGADTADLAAESAAIERYASVTLTIGGVKAIGEDGDQSVQLSVGKGRMGGGDRVIPVRYEGRTGRWIVEGDARPAADVRAQLDADRKATALEGSIMAVIGAASRLTEPVTRSSLVTAAHTNKKLAFIAVERLVQSGELVEVRLKKKGSGGGWMVCPPRLAKEAQIPLLSESPS